MKGLICVVLSALSILSVSASGQCARSEMNPVWDTGQATIQLCRVHWFSGDFAR
jgi:hypothetical protein